MAEALLTTDEVAALLRVHPKQVYRLLRRGLPGRRVGSEWRFVRDEVLAWSGGGTEQPMEDAAAPALVAANGDVAVEILLGLANGRGSPLVGIVPADREGGLEWLRQRAVIASGCHGAGFPARIGDDRLARIHLVDREVGLCARGEVPAIADLAGRRIAGRPPSAGISAHFDEATAQIPRKKLRITPYASHRDVALAVLRGDEEVGVITSAWAARVGLRFAPFATEAYGLVVRAGDLGVPAVVRLCEVAQGREYRTALAAIPGYAAGEAGAIRFDPETS